MLSSNFLEKKIIERWGNIVEYSSVSSCLPRSSFVLLTGLPGSGKSTFSRQLSKKTGAIHFDFSNFTKHIIGKHPQKQSTYSAVGQLIEPLISSTLNNGYSIIYDTTSISKKMRSHHFSSVPSIYPKALVWLNTPKEVCRSRLSLRKPEDRPDIGRFSHRKSYILVKTFGDFCAEFESPHKAIKVLPQDLFQKIYFKLKQELTKNHA